MPLIKKREAQAGKPPAIRIHLKKIGEKLHFIPFSSKIAEPPMIKQEEQTRAVSPPETIQKKRKKQDSPHLLAPCSILSQALLCLFNANAIGSLSEVCQQASEHFQNQQRVIQQAPILLHHLVHGERDKAVELLKNTAQAYTQEAFICLLTTRCNLSDPVNREFEYITAFQYALWSLDHSLWELMLSYLPPQVAAQQLRQHEGENGKKQPYAKKHGNYYDLRPFIDALKNYIEYCDKRQGTAAYSPERASQLWTGEVIRLQHLLPVNIVNAYRKQRADSPSLSSLAKEDLANLLAWHNQGLEKLSSLRETLLKKKV